MKALLTVLICLSLAACSGNAIRNKDGTASERGLSLSGIAKSDVDDITEMTQREAIACLKRLAEKLYRRNPSELGKNPRQDLDAAMADIFDPINHWHLSARRSLDWQASINSAFDANYPGDRIAAMTKGLLTMVMASYGHKTERYILDSLDPQRLYNAARNIEIVAWRLSNARSDRREPLLLSNGVDPSGIANLSFEREFGKLIAIQDLGARIVEDKTNRAIRFTVVNMATMVFLPI